MNNLIAKVIAGTILGVALVLIVFKSGAFKSSEQTAQGKNEAATGQASTTSSKSSSGHSGRSLSGAPITPASNFTPETADQQVMLVAQKARAELEKLKPANPVSQEERDQIREKMMALRQIEDPADRQAAMASLQEERQQQMLQRREEMRNRPAADPADLAARQRLQQTAELENLLRMGRRLGAPDEFDTRLGNFAQSAPNLTDEQLRIGVAEFQQEVSRLRQSQMQSRRQLRGRVNPQGLNSPR